VALSVYGELAAVPVTVLEMPDEVTSSS